MDSRKLSGSGKLHVAERLRRFSIGVSGIEETRAYIQNQEEHHRTRTYREEVIMFLQRHRLTFDDAMLE